MHVCDTLLTAPVIVTQNAAREILENAAIAIKNGVIADIGPADKLKPLWAPEKTINLARALVTPGLINAHTHAAMTFLRGLADDLPLMTWLEKHVFPVEARLTREITRTGSLLGHAEALASGVTACVDMYLFEEEVFAAAEISGIRLLGGEAVFAFPSAACESPDEALEKTAELAEKYAGSDRLRVAINPHSVYTTDRTILENCARLSEKLNLPLHIHLAETRDETERCLREHGARPVEWVKRAGLLDRPLLAAHLVDITPEEAEILAAFGVVGVHNPASNMKLASGAAPAAMMLAKNMIVALGTDGPASNNSLNLVADMRLAALLAKLASGDPSALPASRVLDMATVNGAAAFGDMTLGSLEIGNKADLAAFNLDAPNMRPLHNPVSQLVYAADGRDCVLTMIAGETVYENGRFTRFDYDGLYEEIENLRKFALDSL